MTAALRITNLLRYMFDNKAYWENRLSEKYDLQGVGDISLSINYNKWSYKVTESVLRKLIDKHAGQPGDDEVLDIGSGTGFVVGVLKSKSKRVTGIDISATAVKRLSEKYQDCRFLEFDIGSGRVPLEDNAYSFCTAASVLYHIVDDEALDTALKNIHRILKQGGIFIFSDNFIHDAVFNVTHQKCRTLEQYEAMIQRNGFSILERVPNYVLMNDPVDAKGKFYPRLWSRFVRYSSKSKLVDSIIWPMLYPIELAMVNILKESPAQEFMICKAMK